MTVETIQGYRLSPQQLHVWSAQMQNARSVVQCVVRVEGDLDCRRLLDVIHSVVERHEILRTAFQCLPGMNVPLQVISEESVIAISVDDLSNVSAPEAERQFQEICRRDRCQDFELEKGGLLFSSLIRFSTTHHSLLLTLPALCGDLATLKNLVAEIAGSYAAAEEIVAAGELIQYADCAEIFNDLIAAGETEAGRDYWRKKLDGSLFDVKLPWAKESASTAEFHPDFISVQLDAKLKDEIDTQARAQGVSSQAFLLACWQALLARLTGLRRIPIGVAYDGRNYEEVEKTVGPCAKYLPMTCEVPAALPFNQLVTRIDAELREMAEWQDYFSLKQIAAGNGAASGVSHLLPLFFSFHDQSPVYFSDDLIFTVTQEYECSSRFELKLSCTQTDEALSSTFYYDAGIYTRESIVRVAGQYRKLLAEALKNPPVSISDLEILSDSERRLILSEFAGTETSYGKEQCLHTYFEDQAAQTPERVALVYEEQQLSYGELNRRANQLAHHLRRLGVGTETLVAICLERSLEMAVGLLGVLKAGGAYVPLDPTHPRQRLSFTLGDTKAPVVLTQASLAAEFAGQPARVLCLDTDWEAISGEREENPVAVEVGTANLAYVIYTSGSTGQPKGVQVTHGAVNNHMLWMREQVPLIATDRLLQKTAFTFDASIWEFFLPWMCGARLVLARPGGHQDSAYLIETVAAQEITVLQVVPTMLRALLAERDISDCRSLRRVFCGGEVVTIDLQERFFSLFPEAELYNFYGPTEAAIDVTCWRCERESDEGFVPIGRPLPNVRLYVLDARLQPAPVGVAGELYIGGTSLARGYLNRPELTAERFIPNPFSDTPGTRLYRTGDLAHYLDDGRLEFLGRKDSQVKLRGFRIELGEIESVLDQHERVRTCVVVAWAEASGEQKLVAYVVPKEEQAIAAAELRQYLSERLPVYMIPATFVRLAALPLLTNGKVDRNGLPDPEQLTEGEEREYVAPRTPVEELLAGIWAEVLKLDRVSIDDNFFDLGGHSLLVTQVLARVRDAFSAQLPLRSFFDARSLKELGASIEAEMQTGPGLQSLPLQPVSREMALPLSFGQQRLWFLNQMEPDSALYNIPTAVRLRGVLDVAALEGTFREIIRRHESLRTTFAVADGLPVQVISKTFDLPLRILDLTNLAESEREAEALRLTNEDAVRSFDLAQGPLLRILLLRLSEEDHLLVCTTHHIVSDLWSRAVLLREVSELYAGLTQREPVSLPELPIQYADHAYWERQLLQGEPLETEIAYWKNQLLDAPLVLNLPTDRARPAVQSLRGAKQGIALPQTLLDGLRALNRREGTTMFMTLLAAFNVLLARYSGQQDLLVGTPVSNRDRVEIEGLVGFFANTLVMRTDTSDNPTFRQLLHRVRETALNAYAHRVLPFEILVEELQPQRDPGYTPLFQVMFVHQMAPRETFALPGLSLERMEIGNETSKFDLTLFLVERPENMSAWFEYNSDLFDAATMERLLGHLQILLEAVVANPEQQLRELPLLTSGERQQMLYEWNSNATDHDRSQIVTDLFEAQVERTPDATALIFEEQEYSYAALNASANRLAHLLRASGARPDMSVGILLERSPELLIGVLGILKAGSAYLPLDPASPLERLAAIFDDAQPSLVLTDSQLADKLPTRDAQVIYIDQLNLADYSDANPPRVAAPDNLAYIVYTSGSTGKPKGIAMPHASLANLTEWQIGDTTLTGVVRILQFAALSFDVSSQEMFPAWGAGHTLLMITEEMRHDMTALLRYCDERNVEKVILPVVVLQQLAEVADDTGLAPRSLRESTTNGSQLQITKPIINLMRQTGSTHFNQYGPSETHTMAAYKLEGDPEKWPKLPPIGRPIANTQVYLLDAHGQPVPAGVTGEIYIGGECLARGYINQPDVTANVFVPDPFSVGGGARLYRSGDFGRYLPDGRIECLGRNDHQVKIRGFRVELGEVEATLAAHPSVLQVVVTTYGTNGAEKQLAAYLVGDVNSSELRHYLREKLPEYMIPSAFVMLETLPLNSNGKLDRSGLPAPERDGREAESSYTAPRTATEEVLAGIWAGVLGLACVGTQDDFFDLGGHSLLVTQVASRIRDAFSVELPVRVLFEEPTVERLARAVDSAMRAKDGLLPPPIERAPRHEGPLPVSFMQERTWRMAQIEGRPSSYNFEVKLEGTLNAAILERCLGEVIRRNEVLRTTFTSIEGQPFQVINPEQPFSLPIVDLTGMAEWEREAQGHQLSFEQGVKPFDLSVGPLFRFSLLRLSADSHRLLLTMPHIVCDHSSIQLFAGEVAAVYDAFSNGRPSPFAELAIQYADYSSWEREWLQGEVYETELAYWRKQLDGCQPVLQLPTDRPRPPIKTYGGTQMLFSLPDDLAQAVQLLAQREKCTVFITLLAAFKALLYRYTGQEDMIVGTAIAGRTHGGIERLIGNFGTPLALRTRPTGAMTFLELLKQVRRVALDAYTHQDLPFDRLVEELQPEHDPSYYPLIQVGFVVHTAPPQDSVAVGNLNMEIVNSHSGRSIFDLTVRMHHTPQGMVGSFEYNTDLFDASTISRMIEDFRTLLSGIVADPEQRLAGLPLVDEIASVVAS